MKKVKICFVMVSALLLYGSSALAEQASVERGKELFNNPGLGASQNAISCGTCHPGGEGMEKAGGNPELAAMINRCIKGPLKGEPLDEKTVAMESLEMYLKSLAK
ncbi:MAG: cytochrome-c peroxidase [Proteobacteria bacterium]|nr:cytochrome-c peroxidase [Pseudomonadota bacterium]MBU1639130.1 cytochrome-c peroxidase [Pseudomonadota bacterium]